MDPIQCADVANGRLVYILFDLELSRLYQEPRGRIFEDADGKHELVFEGYEPPYEAYGYHPEHPGNTPIPFWGNHYIKPSRNRYHPRPWASIKEIINRDVFLAEVSGKLVAGKLYCTRVRRYPKLICLQYHRHLVEAYEAVWALVEAMRGLYSKRKIVPSSWKLTGEDVKTIHGKASRLSSKVDHTLYGSPDFVRRILRLEILGLAPHYQPIRDKLKAFSSEMFEIIVAEFIRSYSTHEVYWSYEPPFLNGEVDIYARSSARKGVKILVGSCKLRIPALPRPVDLMEVQNLADRVAQAAKHERVHAQARGDHNVSGEGALFTSACSVEEDAAKFANKNGIAILQVKIPDGWWENPTARNRLKPHDFSFLVHAEGAMLSSVLAMGDLNPGGPS